MPPTDTWVSPITVLTTLGRQLSGRNKDSGVHHSIPITHHVPKLQGREREKKKEGEKDTELAVTYPNTMANPRSNGAPGPS